MSDRLPEARQRLVEPIFLAQCVAEIHLRFDRVRIDRQSLADDGKCFGRSALAKKDITKQVQRIETPRFGLQNFAIERGRVSELPAPVELHCLVEQLTSRFRNQGLQSELLRES